MQVLSGSKRAGIVVILLAVILIIAFFVVENISVPSIKPSARPSIPPSSNPFATFSPSPALISTPTPSYSVSLTPSSAPSSVSSPQVTPISTPGLSPTPNPTLVLTPTPNPSPTVALVSSPPLLPPIFFPSPTPTTPTYLFPGEVMQYQGRNLSSISSVYENAIAGTQYINQTTYRLKISGPANGFLNLTYDDVVNNHQKYLKVVTIYCVEGWNAEILWEGVLVKDLLDDVGLNSSLQAGLNSSAQVVIFFASDGYSTSLPLDYIIQNNIMIAFKMNDVTLTPEIGWPFMLVAQSQYGYKWIKWITQIEVSNETNYLGYWESRGYPNNATLP
jgi:DMSO/TMAO reductase YedYZ molybdopterin-dependent catalytic subunit